MKKNILGMDMTEWKHLSGLADPYKLALAEAGVEAGVPPIVESKPESVKEDDDDAGVPREIQVAQAAAGKKQRMDAIKRSARNLRGKTRNAAEKAANTPAKDRYKATLELAKHRKTFVKEGLDEELMWAVYLEDRGTSAEEFGKLLDIAIESDDEEMAIELIAIEDQLDELLGAIANTAGKAAGGLVKGAQAAGKGMVRGAAAAVGNLAGQAVQGAKSGFAAAKPAMGAPKPAVAAPAAGGGSPAGATPPAGAPPAAPAGASPQAAPAVPAQAAVPAAAPTTGSPAGTAGAAAPKKLGLLGTLGRGIGKVAAGAMGAVKGAAQGAMAATKKEDVDEWEEFIAEEFDMTAEQYVEMFDQAIAEDDQDILGNAHQIDEIFAAWRAKRDAAAQEKQAKVKAGYAAAKAVVAKHGAGAVKAASLRGKAIDAPAPKVAAGGGGTSLHVKKESTEDIAAQIMESSGYAPKAKPSTIKELMGDQLRFSGYTDEHIARKRS